MSLNFSSCDGCGCKCKQCNDQTGLHLHLEIENLKQQLLEKENHILSMETNFLKEADKFPNGEMAAISEELLTWQDKYSRLYEAHKRVQRVNQNLEDKLLRIVDKCETEKNALTSEVANLTRRLVDEKFSVSRLQEENERYRNDVNLAIQLLQCKPSNFVSQKYDSLPSEMQQKVRMYVSNKRRPSDGNGNVQPKDVKTIKVPIPTYPPTAMVYSINNGTKEKDVNEEKNNSQPVDIVSAAIMAKILEEREKERSQTKHCDTCTCCRTKSNKSVQTVSEPSLSSTSSSLSSVNSEKTIGKSFSTKHHKLCPNSVSSLRSRGIYEKDREKDGINHVEITVEKPKVPPFTVDNRWENDSDCSTMSKSAGSNNGVTEGILINIEPTESSSINSTISDGSTSSWPGRPTVVKSESPSDLITFDPRPKTDAADSMQQRHHPTGPRHCSVRLQVGSNNILLDNVVDQYAPILYKNKNSGDPLVHASSRSRSGSDRSSNSSCDEHQPVMNSKKSPFRTETEI